MCTCVCVPALWLNGITWRIVYGMHVHYVIVGTICPLWKGKRALTPSAGVPLSNLIPLPAFKSLLRIMLRATLLDNCMSVMWWDTHVTSSPWVPSWLPLRFLRYKERIYIPRDDHRLKAGSKYCVVWVVDKQKYRYLYYAVVMIDLPHPCTQIFTSSFVWGQTHPKKNITCPNNFALSPSEHTA